MKIRYFIVMDSATGECIPSSKSATTNLELAKPNEKPPRLFKTVKGAKRALDMWQEGLWHYTSASTNSCSEPPLICKPDKTRQQRDMVTVPVDIHILWSK